MKIHHFTIPARDPQRVARVLAELLGAKIIPNPHPTGSLILYAGDADGTAIEVWPAATRGNVGQHEIGPRADLALPEAWPHHAYVSSDALHCRANPRGLRAGAVAGGQGDQRSAACELQPGPRLD